MADHSRKYHLSGAVQDTADYILHEIREVRILDHIPWQEYNISSLI
jgi:hypothetical protein